MTNYNFLSRSQFEHLHPWHIARKLNFLWGFIKFIAYPQTGTQDLTVIYMFMVSWLSEGVNSVYRQKMVPINAKKVGNISLGSRCVEQQPLQFYNIINKSMNLYKGKWMLHSVIFPDTKNGCHFVIYFCYKRNSIQNNQYFISECNRQLVKQRQSFPCPCNEGIQGKWRYSSTHYEPWHQMEVSG